MKIIPGFQDNIGSRSEPWRSVHKELLDFCSDISGTNIEEIKHIKLSDTNQVLITGIVIMADWIASNELFFPLGTSDSYDESELCTRAENGWRSLDLPPAWRYDRMPFPSYRERFGFEARPFQDVSRNVAMDVSEPGIVVVEAPTGEGKTEAALMISEILAYRFGNSGLFFALPTQTTSDRIFTRMKEWVDELPGDVHSIHLAHGKSRYNQEYTKIPHMAWRSSDDHAVIHEWLCGRKRSLLSDFVAGTVDQVLLGGLKRRHLALSHLGLASKVIVVDECHAYDSYMGSYLQKVLEWLGAYSVPVLLLSATLPPGRRKELIAAYMRGKGIALKTFEWCGNRSYPLITYTDGSEVKQMTSDPSGRSLDVSIVKMPENDFMAALKEASQDGGYIAVIVNTVKRAQHFATLISEEFGSDSVRLFHARFTNLDRSHRETELMESMVSKREKPPFRMFVVGTQVLEQSLDLDFDVLFTDLCPMDLLIQRMGRLHRHANPRPAKLSSPKCYVMGTELDDRASEFVYGRFSLLNASYLLPDKIHIPSDVPNLVSLAYDLDKNIPEEIAEDYIQSKEKYELLMKDKEKRAKTYQLRRPNQPSLIDWLNDVDESTETMGEATVRDVDPVVEVILVRKDKAGFSIVSCLDDMNRRHVPDEISEEDAYTISGCRVGLPRLFSSPHQMASTLAALNESNNTIPENWQETAWLRNSLFLILDENDSAVLQGHVIRYSKYRGLEVEE
ncbi:MAG: CRISPR-associated helicase Cas3' [Candidatus Methanomethylophilaceae archaeon]|nr:CRISPR-associated helicase Cas3' [Candidatus Methanomethylophilaceae archaeon]